MNVQQGTRFPTVATAAGRDTRRRAWTPLIILFLAMGLVAALTVTACGQNYDQIKLNPAFENPANLKRMKDAAKRISGTRDPNFPEKNVAEVFFRTYVPAKITQPDAISEITPLINEVTLRMTAARRSNAPFAGTIMGWVYNGLKPVALGNYQPAARISAILAISRIDERPAVLRDGIPPTPLRFILIDFLPVYEDAKNSDGVRAAALHAIHRYVTYAAPTIRGATLAKLKSLMNDLLKQDPPPGRSPKSHAYLQRFAVDILSNLRGKSDPALGQQLISISAEPKKPDLIALYSAARVGEMGADIRGKVNAPGDVLANWAVRAMRAFQYESIRLKALDRPRIAEKQPVKPESIVRPATEKPPAASTKPPAEYGAIGSMDPGMDPSMEAFMEEPYGMESYGAESMMGRRPTARPQPPEVLASRRKLNDVLQQLHMGATGSIEPGLPARPGGLLAGVADDKKGVVEAWVSSMGEVLTALNDKSLDDRKKYVEGLLAQIETLRDIAGPAAEKADAMAPLDIPNVSPVIAAAKAAGEGEAGSDQAVLNKAGIPQLPVEDELSFD